MSIVSHESFASLYADPAISPFVTGTEVEQGVAIAAVFHDFRSSGRPMSTGSLMSKVETLFKVPGVPGAMIMFVKQTGSTTGQLRVIHGFYKYRVNLMQATASDGKTFAYVGDVLGTAIQSVEFNAGQLDMTDTVIVANDTTYQNQLYVDNPALELLPEHPSGATNTRTIKTRKAMYLPYPLVEYVLGKDLNARQTYEILEPIIASKNWTTSCAKLLDFLLVACTAQTGKPEPATLVDEVGGGGQVTTKVIWNMQQEVLYRLLPQLDPVNSVSHGANDRLANVIEDYSAVQATNLQYQADARAAKEAPATIPKKFGPIMTDKILKVTHVVCYTDAPDVYHDLAAVVKNGSEVDILSCHFQTTGGKLGLVPPDVQQCHVQLIKHFRFAGYNMNILTGCLGPFINVPPGAVSSEALDRVTEERQAMEDYMTMTSGGIGTVTLADARSMSSGKPFVSSSWAENEIQYQCHIVQCATFLGIDHPVTQALLKAYRLYEQVKLRVQNAMDIEYGPLLGPPMWLYHCHVHTIAWFDAQMEVNERESLPPPDVIQVIRDFKMGKHLTGMPSYSSIKELNDLRREAVIPLHIRGGGGAETSGGSKRGSEQEGERPPKRGKRVPNPDKQEFTRKLEAAIKETTIEKAIAAATKNGKKVPTDGKGRDRCMSWHVKGACYDNCPRRADHIKLATNEEDKIYKWCTEAYPNVE